eukprot:scaffold1927_cov333-Pavlova_lutheri.AAC.10
MHVPVTRCIEDGRASINIWLSGCLYGLDAPPLQDHGNHALVPVPCRAVHCTAASSSTGKNIRSVLEQ